jgi:hypothetical protein
VEIVDADSNLQAELALSFARSAFALVEGDALAHGRITQAAGMGSHLDAVYLCPVRAKVDLLGSPALVGVAAETLL